MARVALMTVGLLLESVDHPLMQDFVDASEPIFAAANVNSGFIERSLWPEPDSSPDWGEALVPKVFQGELNAENRNAPILSLWKDLEAAYAFAYSGLHAKALRHRREWFMPHDFPGYVLWWVDDNHIPRWSEADRRYEILCQKGASPNAFDFKHPYNAHGQLVQLDREMVQQYMEQPNSKS
ncbi:MAG: DUF3291 domain-containing protein [Anaerolineaceae bacterium]|nr:DUF3291 domain-containing protein [Anaerolineaceae bacterium]